MPELTVTLHHPTSGQSESLPVSSDMTLEELGAFAQGLLGIAENKLIIAKDGKTLSPSTMSLSQAGVVNGDLLVVTSVTTTAAGAAGGAPQQQGLDFSNLLGGSTTTAAAAGSGASGGGGLDFSNLLATSGGGGNSNNSGAPGSLVYFDGMPLTDAVEANPHPKNIVKLIQTHSHLFKELNYHNPRLAQQLDPATVSYDRAVETWRTDMVQGSIRTAQAMTTNYHKERSMQARLAQNPNDVEAKAHYDAQRRSKLAQAQYQTAMQEYPESMGRVLMLYISTKINNHPIQAFVDSGAQSTIMSKSCAVKCGLLDYLDTRFAGVAVGVGTGTILGCIHLVQLQIENTYFPCSVRVMDDTNDGADGEASDKQHKTAPDFLFGLDMLKRHLCSIDLESSTLKIRLPGNNQMLTTPFLHEKDLATSKGGTKGFDADQANREVEEAQQQHREKQGDGDNDAEMTG